MAEGRLVVRRIVEDCRFCVQSLLVNDAALHDLSDAVQATAPDVPIYVCGAEEMHAISGYDVHRGCLALVRRPPSTPVDDLLAAATTVVVLEGVTNADNVGGVFRNAAAFGAGGVVLSPTCCDPLYRKAIRTSMGAALRVPFARVEEWPDALALVRAAGFTIVALTPREPSEELDAFAARMLASRAGRAVGGIAPVARIAILAGTEGAGLTPAVEAAADHRVRIPISAEVDSLNLAVAVGIALHALRQCGRQYRPDLFQDRMRRVFTPLRSRGAPAAAQTRWALTGTTTPLAARRVMVARPCAAIGGSGREHAAEDWRSATLRSAVASWSARDVQLLLLLRKEDLAVPQIREVADKAARKGLSIRLYATRPIRPPTPHSISGHDVRSGPTPRRMLRGAILTFNTTHNNEHYGNIVVYMR